MKLQQITVKKEHKPIIEDEYHVCKRISQYLIEKYPYVLFHFDFASGTRLTPGQVVRMKELNPRRGCPDLFISKIKYDRLGGICHCGCYLEIKQAGTRIYKKNGTPASPHIAEQIAYIEVLKAGGYHAEICVGFEEAKESIDWYLSKYKDK